MKYLILAVFLAIATPQMAVAQSRNEQSATQPTLKLYPTTAKTYVNMYVEMPAADQFHVSLFDSAGVLIKEWDENGSRHFQKTIFVSDMADGNYTIQIKDKKNAVSSANFTVAK